MPQPLRSSQTIEQSCGHISWRVFFLILQFSGPIRKEDFNGILFFNHILNQKFELLSK